MDYLRPSLALSHRVRQCLVMSTQSTAGPDLSIDARRYEVEVYDAASGWDTVGGDWRDDKMTSIDALETYNYHAPAPRRILKDGEIICSDGDARDSDHDAWLGRCPN